MTRLASVLMFVVGMGLVSGSAPPPGQEVWEWDVPEGRRTPRVPADNPMTAAKVELGRHLFYDARLSGNGTFACASCHVQERAFADDKPRGVGSTGEVHPRGSMSLTNVGYVPTLTWANPNLDRLEEQALVPLFGEHPVELGLAGREAELLGRLRAEPTYQALMPLAFPDDADPWTIASITRAIAAFERTLLSWNAPFDRYWDGDSTAISAAARRGEVLFNSERFECFHCHVAPFFSSSMDYDGRYWGPEVVFFNTGLYNIDGEGAYPPRNEGVYAFSGEREDMGRFRPPTLRNIEVTAPYMHDGSIGTLEEVLEHYASGGRTIEAGPASGVGSENPYRSDFVRGFEMTDRERDDVIAFLLSLTDTTFLRDPRFSDPWRSP